MDDHDITTLINYIAAAPRQMEPHVPSRGDLIREDIYRILVTAEQRNFIMDALRSYNPR